MTTIGIIPGASVSREIATIAFIDLAGFSSITNVFGVDSAIAMLEIFEGMVRDAVEGHAPPIKWIGDQVMLFLPEPKSAIGALGRLLTSCRQDERRPPYSTGLK